MRQFQTKREKNQCVEQEPDIKVLFLICFFLLESGWFLLTFYTVRLIQKHLFEYLVLLVQFIAFYLKDI